MWGGIKQLLLRWPCGWLPDLGGHWEATPHLPEAPFREKARRAGCSDHPFPKSRAYLRRTRSQPSPAKPRSIAISFQDISHKKQPALAGPWKEAQAYLTAWLDYQVLDWGRLGCHSLCHPGRRLGVLASMSDTGGAEASPVCLGLRDEGLDPGQGLGAAGAHLTDRRGFTRGVGSGDNRHQGT